MEIVNINESEEKQKQIVNNLIEVIKGRALNEADLGMLKSSIIELLELECNSYMIDIEFEEINNSTQQNDGRTVGFSSEATGANKDICIGLDIKYFLENYLSKDDFYNRADGLVQMLISIYHEIEHSKQNVFVKRARLRPLTLKIAYEMVVKSLESQSFYELNYDSLTSEACAEISGRFTVSELISDIDIINKIKIINEEKDSIDLARSSIGKIYRTGKFENKEKFFRKMCDLYIKRYPKTLYNYPILQKVYDEKGKVKDLEKLFEQMLNDGRQIVKKYSSLKRDINSSFLLQQEYLECSMFYFEVIGPLIEEATEQDYKKIATKFGVYSLQSFLERMEQYFNNKAYERIRYSEFVEEMRLGKYCYENEEEIDDALKTRINAIVRFQNGCSMNQIAELLLRQGGYVRGTRELLLPDIKKRREFLANSLIGVYDRFETKEAYEDRVRQEKSDIDEVIDALYYNRFEGFMKSKTTNIDNVGKNEIGRLSRLLKIAKILSRDAKRDYFGEFLLIPDVNELLICIEKDKTGYLKECIVQNLTKEEYSETEAEQGKYIEYILGKGENSEKINMLNEELPKIKQKSRGNKGR